MSSGGSDLWHMPLSFARSCFNKTGVDRCATVSEGVGSEVEESPRMCPVWTLVSSLLFELQKIYLELFDSIFDAL